MQRHKVTEALLGVGKRTESDFPVLLSLKVSSFCDEIQRPNISTEKLIYQGVEWGEISQ